MSRALHEGLTGKQELRLDESLFRTTSSRLTLSDPILIRRQRLLSVLFNGIPFLGVIFSVCFVLTDGLTTLDMGLFLSMYVISYFGIEGAYHRYFAHRAFKTSRAGKLALAIMGATAAQGPLPFWVANHRRHHQFTDTENDTHSPWYNQDGCLGLARGLWHAHLGWSFSDQYVNVPAFAPDMIKDRDIAFISRYYLVWVLLGIAIPTILGGVIYGSWQGVLVSFLFAGLARIWFVQNGVYIVNSVCHRFGSRPFSTQEKSTNNAWLALPTLGASWHNNHHAFPAAATTQVEWWQIDIVGWVIRGLGIIGIFWDIRLTSKARLVEKRL